MKSLGGFLATIGWLGVGTFSLLWYQQWQTYEYLTPPMVLALHAISFGGAIIGGLVIAATGHILAVVADTRTRVLAISSQVVITTLLSGL